MLATIIFVVCLATAQEDCAAVDPGHDKVSLVECSIHGQQALAEWIEEHPKFVGKGYRCVMGDHPHYNGTERGA
jgi:hypothetical protein